MSTFAKAGPEVTDRVKWLIEDRYPDLSDAKVTFQVIYAYGARTLDGQVKSPALKFGNFPAAALVKIHSLEQRVKGLPDFSILLDDDHWGERSEDEQTAILDHELYHVQVKKTKPSKSNPREDIMVDDAGRPKLRLRPHDFSIGGFWEICKRHGRDALEAQALDAAWSNEYVQAVFSFAGTAKRMAV